MGIRPQFNFKSDQNKQQRRNFRQSEDWQLVRKAVLCATNMVDAEV
jgi:hypothetical protein